MTSARPSRSTRTSPSFPNRYDTRPSFPPSTAECFTLLFCPFGRRAPLGNGLTARPKVCGCVGVSVCVQLGRSSLSSNKAATNSIPRDGHQQTNDFFFRCLGRGGLLFFFRLWFGRSSPAASLSLSLSLCLCLCLFRTEQLFCW